MVVIPVERAKARESRDPRGNALASKRIAPGLSVGTG